MKFILHSQLAIANTKVTSYVAIVTHANTYDYSYIYVYYGYVERPGALIIIVAISHLS